MLVATSDYFKALALGDQFSDSRGSAHVVHEMSAAIFEQTLEYAYTGTCTVEEEDLLLLLQAAGRLQMVSLQGASATALQARLTASNCVDIWTFAERAALAELLRCVFCVDCVAREHDEEADKGDDVRREHRLCFRRGAVSSQLAPLERPCVRPVQRDESPFLQADFV